MDAIFNGNQDYAVGLERVIGIKNSDKVVFRFRGSMHDKRQPCRSLISRLFSYGTEFKIRAGDSFYEYDFDSDSFGDFLPTSEGEAVYIGDVEEIIVVSNTQDL